MTKELYCYDCKHPANTECVERKHRTSRLPSEGGHTPTPWHLADDGSLGSIVDAPLRAVAQTQQRLNDPYHIERQANACFIVRAVNDYHADKEALRGVAIMLNTELAKYENEPWAQRVREALAEIDS